MLTLVLQEVRQRQRPVQWQHYGQVVDSVIEHVRLYAMQCDTVAECDLGIPPQMPVSYLRSLHASKALGCSLELPQKANGSSTSIMLMLNFNLYCVLWETFLKEVFNNGGFQVKMIITIPVVHVAMTSLSTRYFHQKQKQKWEILALRGKKKYALKYYSTSLTIRASVTRIL